MKSRAYVNVSCNKSYKDFLKYTIDRSPIENRFLDLRFSTVPKQKYWYKFRNFVRINKLILVTKDLPIFYRVPTFLYVY